MNLFVFLMMKLQVKGFDSIWDGKTRSLWNFPGTGNGSGTSGLAE